MKTNVKNELGQGMSEYLILVMLIAVASIASARLVGSTVKGKLGTIHRSLKAVTIKSVDKDSTMDEDPSDNSNTKS